MDEEIFQKIILWLEKKIGVSPESMSKTLWLKTIDVRMNKCELNDSEAYFQLLKKSPEELQELTELIVVPETWFFRDADAFEFFGEHAAQVLKQSENSFLKSPFRILSLPCSTGEEPYSIVMALLQKDITPKLFAIDAMDISERAIEAAKIAIYGKNSFRCKDLAFRERYFDPANNHFQLKQEIKDKVVFYAGNVFDPNFLKQNAAMYHVIFCRNLLIYLDKNAQNNLLKILDSLLLPDGLLIVGPSEIECVKSLGYTLDPLLTSFAYHKTEQENHKKLMHDPKGDPGMTKWLSLQQPSLKQVLPLEEAQRLADRGKFEEAKTLCYQHLEKNGGDSQGFFLLGLIYQALGEETFAENYFLKAIYLNADHYEALVYLSLLAAKKGDNQQAELYLTRAERIHGQQKIKEKS